ncbi:MAG: glycoside hydrolase family 88 protein [Candidatus Marinimicrobia bacterium]|nr:glycoside hydrolase family 88 protein [Candidatus Neomarinimicrobiota bacterium]
MNKYNLLFCKRLILYGLIGLWLVFIITGCSSGPVVLAQEGQQPEPIDIANLVAWKVINESAYEFMPVIQQPELGIQIVEFGNASNNVKGHYYALSYINSPSDQALTISVSSTSPLEIWLNDQIEYQSRQTEHFLIREPAYDRFTFDNSFSVTLKTGVNKILVRLESQVEGMKFVLAPLDLQGEVIQDVHFTLAPFGLQVEGQNWVIAGPFPKTTVDSNEIRLLPDNWIGPYYQVGNSFIGWQIPLRSVLWEIKIPEGSTYKRSSYLDWRYENGALGLALYELYDYTRDDVIVDYLDRRRALLFRDFDYFRWQYEYLLGLRNGYHKLFRLTMLDDSGAPALPLAEAEIRNSTYPGSRMLIDSIASYVCFTQQRLTDGTFCRPEPIDNTVWADDLFMSVPFLLRMGQLTGDISYYDDVARQIINFHKYLFDEETGLAHHGWFDDKQLNTTVFWGRANGWMMWAMSEALLILPKEHKDYREILNIFQIRAAGLLKYQNPSGMWHQVLDHPKSYEESSCTAMYTLSFARGVCEGWLNEKFSSAAIKAWNALSGYITADGTVNNICKGTAIGDGLEFYFTRPIHANDPRGLGAVITAGVEVQRLLDTGINSS